MNFTNAYCVPRQMNLAAPTGDVDASVRACEAEPESSEWE